MKQIKDLYRIVDHSVISKYVVDKAMVEQMGLKIIATFEDVQKSRALVYAEPAWFKGGEKSLVVAHGDGTTSTIYRYHFDSYVDSLEELEALEEQEARELEEQKRRTALKKAIVDNYKERLEQMSTKGLEELAKMCGVQV